MPSNQLPVSEAAQDLAPVTGLRSPVTFAEVEAFKQWVAAHPGEPVTAIPGVDPAEIWEAAREAEEGMLTSLEDVFARLSQQK